MSFGYFEPGYIEEDYFEEDLSMAIDALPAAPTRSQAPAEFVETADNFMGSLPAFALQLERVATAMSANSTNSTSTTSNSIASSGIKNFTVEIGKSYVVGMTVKAASAADGTVWMQGDVKSYDAVTGVLSISMSASQGSGTITSWILSLAISVANPTGSLTSDFAVKSLTHAIAASIASAATIDLSAVTGNFVHVTGNTGIGAATMTAGKDVWVIFDGTPILTHHATNHKLDNNGSNITAAAGGQALYTFDGTTVRVIYFAPNGKANQETSPPAGSPIGSFLFHAGSSAPTNYLVCPTSQTNISRSTYASLFAIIGTTWGSGDGSTTFGLPWFPAEYTVLQSSSNVGSTTPGAIMAHSHSYSIFSNAVAGNGTGGSAPQIGLDTAVTGVTGGAANLAAGRRVLICVKYQ